MLSLIVKAEVVKQMPVTVVESVDVDRYCGTWYEVARLPNWFERKCLKNITATYSKNPDGTLKVVNRCKKDDGSLIEATGIARRQSNSEPNTKLKVRFAPRILSFLPFVWGNYWIIDLASDYSYAVVGEPKREYLWILSRTPQLPDSTLQDIIERVKKMGFDTEKLIRIHNSN